MSTVSQHAISVSTNGRGIFEITDDLNRFVSETKSAGLCHVFIAHTSASLLITENADPDVRRDLETFFRDLAPDGDPRFSHDAEGPDDMPAHIRAALTQTTLSIPFSNGRLMLGTWQGGYLWEHRTQANTRRVVLSLQC